MSRFLQAAISITACLVSAGDSQATVLTVDHSPTASGIAYAISLDGSGVGNFNGFALRAYPDAPATFINPGSGALVDRPGSNKTFINPFLEPPPQIGGLHLVLVGKETAATEISFDAGLLGFYINERLHFPMFLANIVLPVGATATASIRMLDTGQDVFSQTIRFGIPEPSSLLLAGLGLAGCLARSRVYT